MPKSVEFYTLESSGSRVENVQKTVSINLTTRFQRAFITRFLTKTDKLMSKSIIRQIIDLQNKSSVEMRSLYRSLFSEPLPYNASHLNLRTKIAYRIQELAIGGLNENDKARLEGKKEKSETKRSDLLPGTKIQRNWNGVVYEVEVLNDGFEFGGQKFKTLSPIAQKITGTKWNGPKFFNLKRG